MIKESDHFDIDIKLGIAHQVSPADPNIIHRDFGSFSWICSPVDFLMKIDEIGSFSIEDRRVAIIDLEDNVSVVEALPFFYGTVVTVMLHMHFRFPIHASSVLGKNGLSLFCAKSGTGKSTLALNLFSRGFPLFSDDKCVLKWDSMLQKYVAKPSIRAVRLWQDAIDNLDSPLLSQDGIPIMAKKDKFQFNLDDAMCDSLQMVNKIFVIRKVKDLKEIKINLLKGKVKMSALKNQIHRPGLIIGEDIKRRHELFISNVAKAIPVYLVRRPEDIQVSKFVDFMESKI